MFEVLTCITYEKILGLIHPTNLKMEQWTVIFGLMKPDKLNIKKQIGDLYLKFQSSNKNKNIENYKQYLYSATNETWFFAFSPFHFTFIYYYCNTVMFCKLYINVFIDFGNASRFYF